MNITVLRKIGAAGAVLALFTVAGCDHMSNTQQRTLSGGAIGAGAGAALGAVTGGSPAAGALIGGAAGAGAGYLTSPHRDNW